LGGGWRWRASVTEGIQLSAAARPRIDPLKGGKSMKASTVGKLIEILNELPPETKVEARDADGNFTQGVEVSWTAPHGVVARIGAESK
jgi:hypothetical protein